MCACLGVCWCWGCGGNSGGRIFWKSHTRGLEKNSVPIGKTPPRELMGKKISDQAIWCSVRADFQSGCFGKAVQKEFRKKKTKQPTQPLGCTARYNKWRGTIVEHVQREPAKKWSYFWRLRKKQQLKKNNHFLAGFRGKAGTARPNTQRCRRFRNQTHKKIKKRTSSNAVLSSPSSWDDNTTVLLGRGQIVLLEGGV